MKETLEITGIGKRDRQYIYNLVQHSEIAALVAERKTKDNGVRIPLEDVIG